MPSVQRPIHCPISLPKDVEIPTIVYSTAERKDPAHAPLKERIRTMFTHLTFGFLQISDNSYTYNHKIKLNARLIIQIDLGAGTLITRPGTCLDFSEGLVIEAREVINKGELGSKNNKVVHFAGHRALFDNSNGRVTAPGGFVAVNRHSHPTEKGTIEERRLINTNGTITSDKGVLLLQYDTIDNKNGHITGDDGGIRAKTLLNEQGSLILLKDGGLSILDQLDNTNGLIDVKGFLSGRKGIWKNAQGTIRGGRGIDLKIDKLDNFEKGHFFSSHGPIRVMTKNDLWHQGSMEAASWIMLLSREGIVWAQQGSLITPQNHVLIKSSKHRIELGGAIIKAGLLGVSAHEQINMSANEQFPVLGLKAEVQKGASFTSKTCWIDAIGTTFNIPDGDLFFESPKGRVSLQTKDCHVGKQILIPAQNVDIFDSEMEAGTGFKYHGNRIRTQNLILTILDGDATFNGKNAVNLGHSLIKSPKGKVLTISKEWFYEKGGTSEAKEITKVGGDVYAENCKDKAVKINIFAKGWLFFDDYEGKADDTITFESEENAYFKKITLDALNINAAIKSLLLENANASFAQKLKIQTEEASVSNLTADGPSMDLQAINGDLTLDKSTLNIKESKLSSKKRISITDTKMRGTAKATAEQDLLVAHSHFRDGDFTGASLEGDATLIHNTFTDMGLLKTLTGEGKTRIAHTKANAKDFSSVGQNVSVQNSNVSDTDKVSVIATQDVEIDKSDLNAKKEIVVAGKENQRLDKSTFVADNVQLLTEGTASIHKVKAFGDKSTTIQHAHGSMQDTHISSDKVTVASDDTHWTESSIDGKSVEVEGTEHTFNKTKLHAEEDLKARVKKITLIKSKAKASDLSIKSEEANLIKSETSGKKVSIVADKLLGSHNNTKADETVVVEAKTSTLNNTTWIAPSVIMVGENLTGTQTTVEAKEWEVHHDNVMLLGTEAKTDSATFNTVSGANLSLSNLKGNIHVNVQTGPLEAVRTHVNGSLTGRSGGDIVAPFSSVTGEAVSLVSNGSINTDSSTMKTKSLKEIAGGSISSRDSKRKIEEDLIQKALDRLDVDGSTTKSRGIFREAKSIGHRHADSRAVLQNLETTYFDNFDGTLGGNIRLEAETFNHRQGKLFIGGETTRFNVGALTTDSDSLIEGPGNFIADHRESYIQNGRVEVGLYAVHSDNPITINNATKVRDLLFKTPEQIFNNAPMVIDEKGVFEVRKFQNNSTVFSHGILALDQKESQLPPNFTAMKHLLFTAEDPIHITTPMDTPGGLSLKSKSGDVKIAAPLKIKGDITLDGSNITLQKRVDATGRGIFNTQGTLHFDHTQASFGDGIEGKTRIFFSDVSDIDIVGKSSLSCATFRLKGKVKPPPPQHEFMRGIFGLKGMSGNSPYPYPHTPSNFRHEGDFLLEATELAENIGSNLLVKGYMDCVGRNVTNTTLTHDYAYWVQVGTQSKRFLGLFKYGEEPIYAERHQLIVDGPANWQVGKDLTLNLKGTLDNDGVMNARVIRGEVQNIRNGIFSNFGRTPVSLPTMESLAGDANFRPGGEIRATEDLVLKVHGNMLNRGYIGGNNLTNIDAGYILNERRVNQEREQVTSVGGLLGRVKKRWEEVDYLNPGGEIHGGKLILNMGSGDNKAGSFQGTEGVQMTGGSYRNNAVPLRSIRHHDIGRIGPFQTVQAYSVRTDFQGAEVVSGGPLEMEFTGDIHNIGSEIAGMEDMLIRARNIRQKTLFSAHEETHKQSFFRTKKLHEIVMKEAGIYSIKGDLHVKTTEDLEVEGSLGSFGGGVTMEAGNARFLANTMSVDNYERGVDKTPISTTLWSTTYNVTKTSLPRLFAATDVKLRAQGVFESEELQVDIGGNFDAEADEIIRRHHVVNHYTSNESVSIGLTFPGSAAIAAAEAGKDPIRPLFEEHPAIKSALKLAESKKGPALAINGATTLVHAWNGVTDIAQAINAGGGVMAGLGKGFGVTDLKGNFRPNVAVRFGFAEQETWEEVAFPPHFNVGNDLSFRARNQLYTLPMSVGHDAEFLGDNVRWKPRTVRSAHEGSSSGISVGYGSGGWYIGADHAENEGVTERHLPSNLYVGNRLKIRANNLEVEGAELNADTTDVKIKRGIFRSVADTHKEKAWSGSFSTAGDVSFSYRSLDTRRIYQVAGITARSHGKLEADSLDLEGAAVKNIEVDAKVISETNVQESEESMSFGGSFNLKTAYDHATGKPERGASVLGTFEFEKQSRRGLVRGGIGANAGVHEWEKPKSTNLGMAFVALNGDKLRQEFSQMQQAFGSTPPPPPEPPPPITRMPPPEDEKTKEKEEVKKETKQASASKKKQPKKAEKKWGKDDHLDLYLSNLSAAITTGMDPDPDEVAKAKKAEKKWGKDDFLSKKAEKKWGKDDHLDVYLSNLSAAIPTDMDPNLAEGLKDLNAITPATMAKNEKLKSDERKTQLSNCQNFSDPEVPGGALTCVSLLSKDLSPGQQKELENFVPNVIAGQQVNELFAPFVVLHEALKAAATALFKPIYLGSVSEASLEMQHANDFHKWATGTTNEAFERDFGDFNKSVAKLREGFEGHNPEVNKIVKKAIPDLLLSALEMLKQGDAYLKNFDDLMFEKYRTVPGLVHEGCYGMIDAALPKVVSVGVRSIKNLFPVPDYMPFRTPATHKPTYYAANSNKGFGTAPESLMFREGRWYDDVARSAAANSNIKTAARAAAETVQTKAPARLAAPPSTHATAPAAAAPAQGAAGPKRAAPKKTVNTEAKTGPQPPDNTTTVINLLSEINTPFQPKKSQVANRPNEVIHLDRASNFPSLQNNYGPSLVSGRVNFTITTNDFPPGGVPNRNLPPLTETNVIAFPSKKPLRLEAANAARERIAATAMAAKTPTRTPGTGDIASQAPARITKDNTVDASTSIIAPDKPAAIRSPSKSDGLNVRKTSEKVDDRVQPILQEMQDKREVKQITKIIVRHILTIETGEIINFAAAMEVAASILKDFSVGTRKECFTKMIDDIPKNENTSFQVINSRDELPVIAQGKSGNSVYFIHENTGATPYVLKDYSVLTHQRGHFAREVLGYKVLGDLKLTNMYIPTLVKVAQYQTKDGPCPRGVLIMNNIDGTSLAIMAQNTAKLEAGSPAKSVQLDQFEAAVEKGGRTMGEIHRKTMSPTELPSPLFIEEFVQDLISKFSHAKANLEKLGIQLNLEEWHFNPIIQAFKKNPGFAGLTHGDTHLANFLYNPKTGTLSGIDPASLAKSLNSKLQPIGVPVADCAQWHTTLEHFGFETGFSELEISRMQSAFHRGYQKEFPNAPHTTEAFEFYRVYRNLERLMRITDSKTPNLEEIHQLIAKITKSVPDQHTSPEVPVVPTAPAIDILEALERKGLETLRSVQFATAEGTGPAEITRASINEPNTTAPLPLNAKTRKFADNTTGEIRPPFPTLQEYLQQPHPLFDKPPPKSWYDHRNASNIRKNTERYQKEVDPSFTPPAGLQDNLHGFCKDCKLTPYRISQESGQLVPVNLLYTETKEGLVFLVKKQVNKLLNEDSFSPGVTQQILKGTHRLYKGKFEPYIDGAVKLSTAMEHKTISFIWIPENLDLLSTLEQKGLEILSVGKFPSAEGTSPFGIVTASLKKAEKAPPNPLTAKTTEVTQETAEHHVSQDANLETGDDFLSQAPQAIKMRAYFSALKGSRLKLETLQQEIPLNMDQPGLPGNLAQFFQRCKMTPCRVSGKDVWGIHTTVNLLHVDMQDSVAFLIQKQIRIPGDQLPLELYEQLSRVNHTLYSQKSDDLIEGAFIYAGRKKFKKIFFIWHHESVDLLTSLSNRQIEITGIGTLSNTLSKNPCRMLEALIKDENEHTVDLTAPHPLNLPQTFSERLQQQVRAIEDLKAIKPLVDRPADLPVNITQLCLECEITPYNIKALSGRNSPALVYLVHKKMEDGIIFLITRTVGRLIEEHMLSPSLKNILKDASLYSPNIEPGRFVDAAIEYSKINGYKKIFLAWEPTKIDILSHLNAKGLEATSLSDLPMSNWAKPWSLFEARIHTDIVESATPDSFKLDDPHAANIERQKEALKRLQENIPHRNWPHRMPSDLIKLCYKSRYFAYTPKNAIEGDHTPIHLLYQKIDDSMVFCMGRTLYKQESPEGMNETLSPATQERGLNSTQPGFGEVVDAAFEFSRSWGSEKIFFVWDPAHADLLSELARQEAELVHLGPFPAAQGHNSWGIAGLLIKDNNSLNRTETTSSSNTTQSTPLQQFAEPFAKWPAGLPVDLLQLCCQSTHITYEPMHAILRRKIDLFYKEIGNQIVFCIRKPVYRLAKEKWMDEAIHQMLQKRGSSSLKYNFRQAVDAALEFAQTNGFEKVFMAWDSGQADLIAELKRHKARLVHLNPFPAGEGSPPWTIAELEITNPYDPINPTSGGGQNQPPFKPAAAAPEKSPKTMSESIDWPVFRENPVNTKAPKSLTEKFKEFADNEAGSVRNPLSPAPAKASFRRKLNWDDVGIPIEKIKEGNLPSRSHKYRLAGDLTIKDGKLIVRVDLLVLPIEEQKLFDPKNFMDTVIAIPKEKEIEIEKIEIEIDKCCKELFDPLQPEYGVPDTNQLGNNVYKLKVNGSGNIATTSISSKANPASLMVNEKLEVQGAKVELPAVPKITIDANFGSKRDLHLGDFGVPDELVPTDDSYAFSGTIAVEGPAVIVTLENYILPVEVLRYINRVVKLKNIIEAFIQLTREKGATHLIFRFRKDYLGLRYDMQCLYGAPAEEGPRWVTHKLKTAQFEKKTEVPSAKVELPAVPKIKIDANFDSTRDLHLRDFGIPDELLPTHDSYAFSGTIAIEGQTLIVTLENYKLPIEVSRYINHSVKLKNIIEAFKQLAREKGASYLEFRFRKDYLGLRYDMQCLYGAPAEEGPGWVTHKLGTEKVQNSAQPIVKEQSAAVATKKSPKTISESIDWPVLREKTVEKKAPSPLTSKIKDFIDNEDGSVRNPLPPRPPREKKISQPNDPPPSSIIEKSSLEDGRKVLVENPDLNPNLKKIIDYHRAEFMASAGTDATFTTNLGTTTLPRPRTLQEAGTIAANKKTEPLSSPPASSPPVEAELTEHQKNILKVYDKAMEQPKGTREAPLDIDVYGVLDGGIIPHYGRASAGSLQPHIELVKDVLSLPANQFKLVGKENPNSGNILFTVFGSDGTPLAMIKEFHASQLDRFRMGFIPEIVSNIYLTNKRFTRSSQQELLGLGTYTTAEGTTHGLVISKIIQGKPQSDILVNGWEGIQAREFGRAIGEAGASSEACSVSEQYLAECNQQLWFYSRYVFPGLKERSILIRMSEERIEKIIQDAMKHPGFAGLSNGNTNLNNFIVNGTNLTMVNTSPFVKSFDRSGKAHGIPLLDQQRIINEVRYLQDRYGPQIGGDQWIPEFYAGINEVTQLPCSQEMKKFADLFSTMKRLYSLTDPKFPRPKWLIIKSVNRLNDMFANPTLNGKTVMTFGSDAQGVVQTKLSPYEIKMQKRDIFESYLQKIPFAKKPNDPGNLLQFLQRCETTHHVTDKMKSLPLLHCKMNEGRIFFLGSSTEKFWYKEWNPTAEVLKSFELYEGKIEHLIDAIVDYSKQNELQKIYVIWHPGYLNLFKKLATRDVDIVAVGRFSAGKGRSFLALTEIMLK